MDLHDSNQVFDPETRARIQAIAARFLAFIDKDLDDDLPIGVLVNALGAVTVAAIVSGEIDPVDFEAYKAKVRGDLERFLVGIDANVAVNRPSAPVPESPTEDAAFDRLAARGVEAGNLRPGMALSVEETQTRSKDLFVAIGVCVGAQAGMDGKGPLPARDTVLQLFHFACMLGLSSGGVPSVLRADFEEVLERQRTLVLEESPFTKGPPS